MRLTLSFLIIIAAGSRGGRPRVYNALISTNQELLPSRAYPAVSPVIGQPVYLTSSVEIHHKQNHDVDTQQPYQESPYEYQGQEIDQGNYGSYDDQPFQSYEREERFRPEVPDPVPENTRRSGHLTQELSRPPQELPRVQQEVARHSARPPALQDMGRRHFQRSRNHPVQPKEEIWPEDEEPEPPRRPAQRNHSNSRNRTREKSPVAQPTSPPSQPGLPPLPSQFYRSGGIPLNNQPGNIPVVPPPPIPIRLKD